MRRIQRLSLSLLGVLVISANAQEDGPKPNQSVEAVEERESKCVQPPFGNFFGACEARAGILVERSPHALHKWITCRQVARGWGSGGASDAEFFSNLVGVWDSEISANLKLLEPLLGKKDSEFLVNEQAAWEKARKKALERIYNQPRPDGSMYGAFAAIAVMNIPEKRALELGCRIEKLKSKTSRGSSSGAK